MKVKIEKVPVEPKAYEFPLLVRWEPTQMIILMDSINSGTILDKGLSNNREGEYRENLFSLSDNSYTILGPNEAVALSNE